MAIQFVVGGLGDGKSMFCVSKVQEYLAKGKKVATNYNLDLAHLCASDDAAAVVIRVPDSPSRSDLRAIGLGSDRTGDRYNGLLLLDELGTWFNARDFANKTRHEVLDYIIHLRKKRWDVMFIVQDFSMVDKQLRGGMTTYLTSCRSSHKSFFMLKLLPEFHIAATRNKDRILVDREYRFKGESMKLRHAYDHEQLFNVKPHVAEDLEFGDPVLIAAEKHYIENNGLYCYLPNAKAIPPAKVEELKKMGKFDFRSLVLPILCIGSLWLIFGRDETVAETVAADPVQTEQPELPGTGQSFTDLAVPVSAPGPLPQAAAVDPFLARFESYRILSQTRFGDVMHFTFDDGVGNRITDTELLDEGFRIINKGANHVVIMEPGQRFITVREFRRSVSSIPHLAEQ